MYGVENEPASSLVVPLGKALAGFLHFGVVDRWPATPTHARYCALSLSRDKYKSTIVTNPRFTRTYNFKKDNLLYS